MNIPELRDPTAARQFVTQGLWLQCIVPAQAEQVAVILDWALAIASEGEPLPPIGFVADVGHMIVYPSASVAPHTEPIAGWPAGLMRTYEDYVLGKLLADSAFDRASDALRPFQGRDRVKGLAFVINQMRQRAGFAGVLLSPAVLKSLRDANPDDVLADGWTSLQTDGPMPLLMELYQSLIAHLRAAARTLGAEDIFELERRTAIAAFGQRVALRQVLCASQVLDDSLPARKPRSSGRRYDVPTRIIEEDSYPIGGFSSISTRGTIESLLHSQLALMEPHDRPDLFDIKFLRDELLFYSRDENSFLRRRRTFILGLYPDLVDARCKDADLPYQRTILLLALVQSAIRKLIDWLSTDALLFEIVLVTAPGSKEGGSPLAAERELLEVLLAEQIENGTVTIEALPATAFGERCRVRSRRSLCHCLLVGVQEHTVTAEHTVVSRLVLNTAIPSYGIDDEPLTQPEGDNAWHAWSVLLERLVVNWM